MRNPGPAKPDQLPLELPVEHSNSRDDLIESAANRLAVEMVDGWPDWPSRIVILAGPVGSGKSHIAAVWANAAGARILPMRELADHLAVLPENTSLVLEDAAPGEIPEEALFHAINRAKLHGAYIIITSREFPAAWGMELADLKSRIAHAHTVELREPDDTLLAAVMVKLFADRQVEIDPQVISYLVNRMERSLGTACLLVEKIDAAAMSRKSRITRRLAGEVLQEVEKGEA